MTRRIYTTTATGTLMHLLRPRAGQAIPKTYCNRRADGPTWTDPKDRPRRVIDDVCQRCLWAEEREA